MKKTNKKILSIFITLSLIYLMEALLIPPDSASLTKFNLSLAEAKLLTLTITIPVILIWMLGCYVYIRFKSYINTISNDRDGKAFTTIAHGLLPLFLWLPISSIFSNLATYAYHNHPSWTATLVITNNYLNLLIVLLAFYLIYKGTQELTNLRESRKAASWKYLAFIPLIPINVLFIFLSLNNPARQFPTPTVHIAAFYLSDWLLVSTIIIPYLLVFCFGFFAVANIYIFRTKVRGVIYKNALDNFAKGLLCITTSIIFIRYLASLTTTFNNATLKMVLLIIYLLVAILLLGYILLVRSVKKLQAIEKA